MAKVKTLIILFSKAILIGIIYWMIINFGFYEVKHYIKKHGEYAPLYRLEEMMKEYPEIKGDMGE